MKVSSNVNYLDKYSTISAVRQVIVCSLQSNWQLLSTLTCDRCQRACDMSMMHADKENTLDMKVLTVVLLEIL